MKKITLSVLSILSIAGLNAQTPSFTEVTGTPFENVQNSAIAWADVDGDTDLDVIISGENASNMGSTKLFTNDGNGVFTEVMGTPFTQVYIGSIAFADVDGDTDQDVLITGYDGTTRIAKLYTNDGSGTFTEVIGTIFDPVSYSDVDFADIDGDLDMDVIIIGENNSAQRVSKLYTNDGSGTFSLVAGTPFDNVFFGSANFVNVDGDTDMDLIIHGLNGAAQPSTRLYKNDGSGGFTLVGSGLENVQRGAMAYADIDGDTDIDVVLTGYNAGSQRIARLYTNDGTGSFTSVANPFTGVQNSSVEFADVDNDSDQDVLITGFDMGASRIARLYLNDGTGSFSYLSGTPFAGVNVSASGFADINNDTYIDVLISGAEATVGPSTKLYSNYVCSALNGTDTRTECDSVVWLDGITYTADNSTATHVLSGAGLNGCDSTVHLNLTIVSVGDITTTLNGLTVSANNTSATYQWLDCNNSHSVINGETNQDFTATANGQYAVELSENGCKDTSSCVTISSVGLNENGDNAKFIVFPNPTEGSFQLTFEKVMTNVEVSILSVDGKVIQNQVFKGTDKINLQIDQPAGVYYIDVQTPADKKTISIVKK
ncbi:MAG: T9SS type A sorting domain-containing protein [Crocinitomicaceae bacterium]